MLLLILLMCLVALTFAQPIVTDPHRNVTYTGATVDGIENFLNIRYGEETSGERRFKHPKAFLYPSGTEVRATNVGAACPQKSSQIFLGVSEPGATIELSEDCLNLRIARPIGTNQSSSLPVMVWIYGGGDESGQAYDELYNPTGLVQSAQAKGTPIIYVAMNYRVNVFGFANLHSLAAEGSLNSGLLDQRLALEWIQENIAYFGGDSASVTLFGESDGGTGAGLHLTAYGGKKTALFHRAIMQSGSPSSDPGVSGNFTAQSTEAVASLANCSEASQTLTCLRELPMADLLKALLLYENVTASRIPQDIFFPVEDGSFIPAPPSTLLRTGHFHKNVSIVAGWNYNDGSLFTSPTITTSKQTLGFVSVAYPHLKPATIKTLLGLYPSAAFLSAAAASKISPEFLRSAQIYRDIDFACPAINVAQAVATHGSPSYLYELNATALAPLLALANASFLGVLHVSDVPYVFNEVDLVQGQHPLATDVEIASRMSGSWAHFASTGNPVGKETLPNWPPATSEHPNKMIVRIIGGPEAGTGQYALDVDLMRRCEFINSPSFYAQIQT